jgi:hypothetical protein
MTVAPPEDNGANGWKGAETDAIRPTRPFVLAARRTAPNGLAPTGVTAVAGTPETDRGRKSRPLNW